jgi:hypothetical protein
MTTSADKIAAEFGTTNSIFDALVERHGRLERDMAMWREQISMDGMVLELNNSGAQGHPLMDRVLKAEAQVHVGLRSMWWIIAATQQADEEPLDEFDAFLAEQAKTGRPRQRQHGG